MYRKFEIAIKQLQGRAEFKNEILERKLAVFQRDYERKEMTLRELVQRSGLDQATVDNICKNMEEAIEAKNSILRNLKYSLAHAIKAYNDAIRVYEAKLLEFGIPADELGIEPLVTNTSTMPAGLVAAWRSFIIVFRKWRDRKNVTDGEKKFKIAFMEIKCSRLQVSDLNDYKIPSESNFFFSFLAFYYEKLQLFK